MNTRKALEIEVSPNVVEHLGLNLYTDLPRVLVEFVANSHDADSPAVDIAIDFVEISAARAAIKERWNAYPEEQRQAAGLDEQVLPEGLQIVIEDSGHGMSRDDLQEKFLRIARKRRKEDGTRSSPKGRLVMGRKGLGKLAGFGVARRIQVVTRPANQTEAISVTLEFDELNQRSRVEQVQLKEQTHPDGAGLAASGTRIVLSSLVYGPTSTKEATLREALSKHFLLVKPEDFVIRLNSVQVPSFERSYAFCFPEPALPVKHLVLGEVAAEDGRVRSFDYRIRFTAPKNALAARDRGIRIYSSQRLASPPDLLDLTTNMHGFQNTHYLDGEVVADFLDDQESDLTATDRQGLRWETPLLAALRKKLTEEMRQACIQYQNFRDARSEKEIEEDSFTKSTLDGANLSKRRRKTAEAVARRLATIGDGVEGEYYKSTLPIIVKGLGYGDLMQTIGALAKSDHPELHRVVTALSDLTGAEWDDYVRIVTARLKGIEVLDQICRDRTLGGPDDEQQLHELLERNPWLVDVTFWAFLTSDQSEATVLYEISRALGIGSATPSGYDSTAEDEIGALKKNTRPDLVFLLGNRAMERVVIVELKSPNTPLHIDHLHQLEGYIARTTQHLKSKFGSDKNWRVEGLLIGSRRRAEFGRSEKVVELEHRESRWTPADEWRVMDLAQLLEATRAAHKELLEVAERDHGALANDA